MMPNGLDERIFWPCLRDRHGQIHTRERSRNVFHPQCQNCECWVERVGSKWVTK